jgi:hypothetical protein
MADGFPARHCHHRPDLTVSDAGKSAARELDPVGVHLDHPSAGHRARLVLDKVRAVVEVEAAQLADAAEVRRKPDAVPSAA